MKTLQETTAITPHLRRRLFELVRSTEVALREVFFTNLVVIGAANVPGGGIGRIEKHRLVKLVNWQGRHVSRGEGVGRLVPRFRLDFSASTGCEFSDRLASLMSASSLINDSIRRFRAVKSRGSRLQRAPFQHRARRDRYSTRASESRHRLHCKMEACATRF